MAVEYIAGWLDDVSELFYVHRLEQHVMDYPTLSYLFSVYFMIDCSIRVIEVTLFVPQVVKLCFLFLRLFSYALAWAL